MINSNFFLEKSIFNKLIVFIVISYLISSALALVGVAVLVILLFLFRKQNLMEKEKLESNILVAPTSGKIESEEIENMRRVTIKISFWSGYGLCMPLTGEITDYNEKTKTIIKIFRIKLESVKQVIEFVSSNGARFKLTIQNYTFGKKESSVWVRPGDLAKRGAYLGYLPFGGNIVIDLPTSSELIAKRGDYLMAGNTVFAQLKG